VLHCWQCSPIITDPHLPKREVREPQGNAPRFHPEGQFAPNAQEKLLDSFETSVTTNPPAWKSIVRSTKYGIRFVIGTREQSAVGLEDGTQPCLRQ
jgi:hypothetical protein